MGRWGSCDFKQVRELQKRLERLAKEEQRQFCEVMARELAARLLAKVIHRTPVGDYQKDNIPDTYKRDNTAKGIHVGDAKRLKNGDVKRTGKKKVSFTTKDGKTVNFTASSIKMGGTLRRGWTAQTEAEAKNGSGKNGRPIQEYVAGMRVSRKGDIYEITVFNPVIYASYVEFGHRTANHKGWVPGKFMLTLSENELLAEAPALIQKKLAAHLQRCLDGK